MKEHFLQWSQQITPWLLKHGIRIVIILIAAIILRRILAKFIEKAVRLAVKPDDSLDVEAERKREDTLIYIFTATSTIALFSIVILMILQEMGVMIGPILAGAGIVGLAFGFGGQYLIRDIISGLFIIMENQYRIGDVIRIDDAQGLVENISMRMTTIRDTEGTVHHIPHGEIKKVSNLSKSFSRVNINLGISYNSNIEQVISVVNEVGNTLAEDPEWKDSIIKAPQFLRIHDFADSSIIIKIVGDTIPHKQWDVAGELRKRLKNAFDKQEIEIPFPQRVIHQSN